MSVSLEEVLKGAGYDVGNDLDDAEWLLGCREEFDDLYEIAEELVEKSEEWGDD